MKACSRGEENTRLIVAKVLLLFQVRGKMQGFLDDIEYRKLKFKECTPPLDVVDRTL